ncbi:DNA translocase FtsK, partial [Bacillus pumilus]|uniref:DNA translocase FtsK n=1 Tax=Bacillus pumilus TaxID=1408 RepID=UPI0034D961B9
MSQLSPFQQPSPPQKQHHPTSLKHPPHLLNPTLKNFNLTPTLLHLTQPPSLTTFQLHPQPRLKLNKITNLSHDIKLTFSPNHIRIQP